MGDDFKEKRQQAMIKGFREMYGPELVEKIRKDLIETPSMGALVDIPICRICGFPHQHEPELVGPVMGPAMDAHRDIPVTDFPVDTDWDAMKFGNFIPSFVKAPPCETCGKRMKYLDRGTDWACQDETCERFGVSVTTGIGGVVGSSVE